MECMGKQYCVCVCVCVCDVQMYDENTQETNWLCMAFGNVLRNRGGDYIKVYIEIKRYS